MELLDEVQVKAINLANGKNLPEFPTLMFELIGTGGFTFAFSVFVFSLSKFHMMHKICYFTEAYTREQTLIVQKLVSEHSGSDFVFAEDPEAKKELWKVS